MAIVGFSYERDENEVVRKGIGLVFFIVRNVGFVLILLLRSSTFVTQKGCLVHDSDGSTLKKGVVLVVFPFSEKTSNLLDGVLSSR